MNKAQTKNKSKQEKKEIKITKKVIKERLISHFKNHIGKDNKTSQEEIFQVVTGFNSLAFDGFQRFYIWKHIEQTIRELRRQDKCFIIKRKGNYAVLKEQEEADYYKSICDKAIKNMENSKVRADDWVDKEKWREFENSEEKPDLEYEIVKEKSPIEKVEELKEQAKTKVIRLWDKENGN